MIEGTEDLVELEQEIRKIIKDNEKFLARILDEEFPDDEDGEGKDSEAAEEP
jgi:hypothetical protein